MRRLKSTTMRGGVMINIRDFEKLESPFVRELNEKGEYVVTNKISEGYDWVFTDPEVNCSEKLDGTNVSVIIENGMITSIWNRTARIPFFCKGKMHIVQGVMSAYERGYCELPDGQHWGELVGEKLQKNPYKIQGHLWIPFSWLREHCDYECFHKHPKTYEGLKAWFENPLSEGGIFSRFMRKRGILQSPEGVVFYQPSTGKFAKIRRDMMPAFVGRRHYGKPEDES